MRSTSPTRRSERDLSEPSGAAIADGSAIGTITDDDAPGVAAVQPSGTVLVRLPRSKRFVRLPAEDRRAAGTEIDATKGRVRLTPPGQGDDSAVFYGGRFVYRQVRENGRLITELTLSEPLDCAAGARSSAGKKARRSDGCGATARADFVRAASTRPRACAGRAG